MKPHGNLVIHSIHSNKVKDIHKVNIHSIHSKDSIHNSLMFKVIHKVPSTQVPHHSMHNIQGHPRNINSKVDQCIQNNLLKALIVQDQCQIIKTKEIKNNKNRKNRVMKQILTCMQTDLGVNKNNRQSLRKLRLH